MSLNLILDINVVPVLILGLIDILMILIAYWFRKKKLVTIGTLVMLFLYVVALTMKARGLQ